MLCYSVSPLFCFLVIRYFFSVKTVPMILCYPFSLFNVFSIILLLCNFPFLLLCFFVIPFLYYSASLFFFFSIILFLCNSLFLLFCFSVILFLYYSISLLSCSSVSLFLCSHFPVSWCTCKYLVRYLVGQEDGWYSGEFSEASHPLSGHAT